MSVNKGAGCRQKHIFFKGTRAARKSERGEWKIGKSQEICEGESPEKMCRGRGVFKVGFETSKETMFKHI